MNYSILDLSQSHIWKKYFNALPATLQDIYFTPEYYEVHEKSDKGSARCFAFEDMGKVIIYPFLIKPISPLGFISSSKEYFDIEGAYGYNGAISNTNDPHFIKSFNDLFCEYARKENIIAEFTRFNPMLKNHVFSSYLQIVHANNNVLLDLANKNFWLDDYEHSTRKNVNKAQRNNLSVVSFRGNDITKEWFNYFYAIYIDTMNRNNANESYFFDQSFFDLLLKNLNNNSLLFFTIKDTYPISTELVLFNRNIAYSFLGGTNSDYYPLRPNDILKHHVILTLKEYGIHYYCLGGGIKMGDGLFKYKRSFAKNGITNFYIGKKIHREEIYNHVVSNWENQHPEKKDIYKDFLLKYRL